jgi:hypothetical protein
MAAPDSKVRCGAVQATVWSNKVGENVIQSVTIQKSYKDKDSGEWKNTTSFKLSEIPHIITALQRVYEDKYLKDDEVDGNKDF